MESPTEVIALTAAVMALELYIDREQCADAGWGYSLPPDHSRIHGLSAADRRLDRIAEQGLHALVALNAGMDSVARESF